jgi:hypothetical protein
VSNDEGLGAQTQAFERRHPFRLVLFVVPALTTVIFLGVLAGFTRGTDKAENGVKKPSVGVFAIACAAEVASIAGYVWLRRKLRPTRFALHEHGYVWRGRATRWDEIDSVGENAHGGLHVMALRMKDGTRRELHGHLVGRDVTAALAGALRDRGLLR